MGIIIITTLTVIPFTICICTAYLSNAIFISSSIIWLSRTPILIGSFPMTFLPSPSTFMSKIRKTNPKVFVNEQYRIQGLLFIQIFKFCKVPSSILTVLQVEKDSSKSVRLLFSIPLLRLPNLIAFERCDNKTFQETTKYLDIQMQRN